MCRFRRYRRTARFPPRRHNRKAPHVQPKPNSIRLATELRHLQNTRFRPRSAALLHSLPRSWIRRSIQSLAKNIQVRRSAVCARLPVKSSWRCFRSDVRAREWQGDDARDCGELDWNRRDRLITARRAQDQETDESRGLPWTGRDENRRGRRFRIISGLGLDGCAQCAWIVCAVRRLRGCEAVSL